MKPKYKRMVEKMHENATGDANPWHVYILECADGTYYTGIAKDLEKRIDKHNAGKGARYTRSRGPVRVIYQECCTSRSAALIRECAVKALPRNKKEILVKTTKGNES